MFICKSTAPVGIGDFLLDIIGHANAGHTLATVTHVDQRSAIGSPADGADERHLDLTRLIVGQAIAYFYLWQLTTRIGDQPG